MIQSHTALNMSSEKVLRILKTFDVWGHISDTLYVRWRTSDTSLTYVVLYFS